MSRESLGYGREVEKRIEAVLFASGDPVTCERLSQVLEIPAAAIRQHVEKLRDWYEAADSALRILSLGDSFQLCSREPYAPFIRKALEAVKNTPLSQAAMEVLAVIAYNQPVTKQFVEQVRGVDSSSVVNTLAERGLIEEAGRLELPGRPISYRTTHVFLRSFGLSSLEELPPIPGSDPGSAPEQGEKTET